MLIHLPELFKKGDTENDIDEFLYKLMRSGYSVMERRQIQYKGRRQYENRYGPSQGMNRFFLPIQNLVITRGL